MMMRNPLLPLLRLDPRLRWLLAAALLLIAGELALRGWESHDRLTQELRSVRARAALLATSSDQIDWTTRTQAAEAQRRELQARLWQSPSEAQAQSRLRDWLASALRSAAVERASIGLLPVLAAPAARAASAADGATPLRVRATVAFELTPGALERSLLQIEAGGQLARIDSLSAGSRTRRVEMTVSVPVLLQPEAGR